jgi:trehalose 6-phosphate phosphatase
MLSPRRPAAQAGNRKTMLPAVVRSTLAARPCGLVFDLDGTLSPIAPTPEEARLYPGVAAILERLRSHAQVAILTGRAVRTAAALVGVDGITYIGNHGLEWASGLPDGHPPAIAAEAEAYRAPARRLLSEAEQRLGKVLPGLRVEYKEVGGTIHYRLCPEPAQARQQLLAFLTGAAREAGLQLGEGKMAVEVRVPGLNKGEALRRFVAERGLRAVLFAGDDRTDLDALAMLARLRTQGVGALAVAVQHPDTPPELTAQADLVVQGIEGMVALLQEILSWLESSAPLPPDWQEKRV